MTITFVFTSPKLFVWTVQFGRKFLAFTLAGVGYAGQARNFG